MKTRLFTALVVLSNVLGNFALSWGMKHVDLDAGSPLAYVKAIFHPWVLAGIGLLTLWTLSKMALLSWADLSYVLQVTSIGYVLNALMGYWFLGETVSTARWAGTLLIVGGTVVVGRTAPGSAKP